jgi:hypothetical protein
MNFRDPAMTATPFDYTPGQVEYFDAAAAASCSCGGSPSTPHVDATGTPDPDAARRKWLADMATTCSQMARQETADQNAGAGYDQYRARLTGNNGGPSPAQFAAAAAAQSAKQDFAVARTNGSVADPDKARKDWIERTQGARHADKI